MGNVTFNLTAADAVSGTERIVISLDGGQWTDYLGNFSISVQGNHTLRYLAIDKAGNNETERNQTIKVDMVAPFTLVTLNGTGGVEHLDFNSSVSIAFTSMDIVSGTNITRYSLDAGAWTSYTNKILVAAEGNHSLVYWSTDRAGNAEQWRTVNFSIDLNAPTTGLSTTGSVGSGGWYNGTVIATWNARDDISGVLGTYYSLDGGDWTISPSTLAISADGTHRLDYYSVDQAGNAEGARTFQFKLDSVLPAANISLIDGMAVDSSHLTVTVSSADNGSGIASMMYSVDGNEYTSCLGGKIIMTGLNGGQHTLLVRTTDQAGNVAVQTLAFTVNSGGGMDPMLSLILLLLMIGAVVGLIVVWRKSKGKR